MQTEGECVGKLNICWLSKRQCAILGSPKTRLIPQKIREDFCFDWADMRSRDVTCALLDCTCSPPLTVPPPDGRLPGHAHRREACVSPPLHSATLQLRFLTRSPEPGPCSNASMQEQSCGTSICLSVPLCKSRSNKTVTQKQSEDVFPHRAFFHLDLHTWGLIEFP